LTLGGLAACEQLSYRASMLDDSGAPQFLAEGTVDYVPSFDIVVAKVDSADGPWWSKGLPLFDDWFIAARVFAEQEELDGFGLTIGKWSRPRGFSWEWFVRGDNELFVKLQSEKRTRVKATVIIRDDGRRELVAVEFLDDTTLRYLDDMDTRDASEHTHEIVIMKGSVLRLAR
jgi:hypothetical protein